MGWSPLESVGSLFLLETVLADSTLVGKWRFFGLRQRDLKRGNLWEYGQLKKHPDGKVWEVRSEG